MERIDVLTGLNFLYRPMPRLVRSLVSIILLLQSFTVFAQGEFFNFYKPDTYTGLSHDQVNSILKDQWHVDGNAHEDTGWADNLYLFVQRM